MFAMHGSQGSYALFSPQLRLRRNHPLFIPPSSRGWLVEPTYRKAQTVLTESWGKMDETVEKSCWGITLWAVAIVVGLAVVASLVVGIEPSATVGGVAVTTG